MTDNDTMNQIQAILLQNTSQIATLLESQVKLQQGMEELRQAQLKTQQQLDEFASDTRASIEDLVQMGLNTYQLVAENSNAIRSMQSEVRGLQVENRRILRELRDRRNNQGS